MDKFSELKAAAMAATPGPWEWFTSNSMARLSSTPSGKDGDVLSAFRASDGVPCVSVSQHDMAFIAAVNPVVVLAMLAELEFEKQNNSGVAGMVEDYETKLEAKDKRIAELEAKLARFGDVRQHYMAGYDDGHSRGINAGRLYKEDTGMVMHRHASANAYAVEGDK